jgi:beta-galactosidase
MNKPSTMRRIRTGSSNGSETGSVVQSRGIYHFPFEKSLLANDDEQCSELGNRPTNWGAKSTS